MRIALVQNDSHPGDKALQLCALEKAAAAASEQHADLLVCPELFMTGYNLGPRIAELAEPQGGPFMHSVQALARRWQLTVVYGYAESDDGVYNSAAAIDAAGKLVVNHRKLHLAPGAFERSIFAPGSEFGVFETGGLTAAVLICYDLEFPEAVRTCAKRKVDLLIVPTALRRQYAHLTQTLVPTRAFENGIFVVYVNYAGSESGWEYCGMSCVAGPDGHLVAQCGEREQLLVVDVDPAMLAAARASIPYLQDLRESLYS